MAKYDPPALRTGSKATMPVPTAGNTYVTAGSLRRFRLVVTTAGATGVNGAALTTQPVITIVDHLGATVTTDSTTVVTAEVFMGDAFLTTATATASSGVATFSGFRLDQVPVPPNNTPVASLTQIRYTAPNCQPVIQEVQVVTTYGAANKSSLRVQPVGAASGAVLSVQPVVNVLDAQGVLVANSTVNVVASKASGTGTIGGTLTVAAVAGVATFTNLTMTTAGSAVLRFTPTALTAVDSGTVVTT